jgi:hypothetical protein
MAFIYGSSNVYRFYKSATARGLSSLSRLELVECTRLSVFETHSSNLDSPQLIITSVLANFICDVCDAGVDEGYGLFGNQVISRHVEYLNNLVTKWPSLVVAVVPPLLRSKPDWFADHHPQFVTFLESEIARVKCSRLKMIQPFAMTVDMLSADSVHLNLSSGTSFLHHLDRQIRILEAISVPVPTGDVTTGDDSNDLTIIETVSSDTEEEEALDPGLSMDEKLNRIFAAVSGSSSKMKKISSRVDLVESSHAKLDGRLTARRKQDNLVFARLKEEADYETNRSREDRVVITGLPAMKKGVSTHKEKKEHYIALITDLVKIAVPGLEPLPTVLDVYLTVRPGRALPVVEARFDSVGGAIRFRTEAAQLAKESSGKFAGLFFTNSATLATRVRIEIMRAIALKLTTDTEEAYVQGFISRPLLHYRSVDPTNKVAGGADRSYTFVDAVSRFGDLLLDSDLTASYARAGHTFAGAMEHYFVILSEGHAVPPRPAPGGYRGRGRPFAARGPRGRKRYGEFLETPSKKK